MNIAAILTQWDFHRVQEHPNRNSDEEVMTFRSWRSYLTKLSHPGNLPYFLERPFSTSSGTQYHPRTFGWKLDSMVFPWSPRTPESKFGRESYGLQIWMSHMTKLYYPGSLPYLPGQPFPAGSETHCPPKASGWKFDSMGIP